MRFHLRATSPGLVVIGGAAEAPRHSFSLAEVRAQSMVADEVRRGSRVDVRFLDEAVGREWLSGVHPLPEKADELVEIIPRILQLAAGSQHCRP